MPLEEIKPLNPTADDFAMIEDIDQREEGVYIDEPGSFVGEIEEALYYEDPDGRGPKFRFKVRVVEALEGAYREGQLCLIVRFRNSKHNMHIKTVLSLVRAATKARKRIGAAEFSSLFADEGRILIGKQLLVKGVEATDSDGVVKTGADGTPYINLRFYAVDDSAAEEGDDGAPVVPF